ncbi:ETC complex I subunit conserved region-domain-containing protein [Aspergillus granulosus]|uniref:ETC complex I subunit conserved region-domain-containing protein n=1 Tax=Aspergillus granulosus TaxID=176169 RepID=A0ABR4HIP2_9EURO
MRSTLRLLASVKPARYLEPFAPTGLAGLTTHPSPRPTLIYIYRATLEKLKAFPESSAYRQSTEALTRHRLQIIESTKPPGFEAWLERVKKTVGAEPERFASLRLDDGTYVGAQRDDGSDNPRGEEWDGEKLEATTEGPARTPEQQARWEQAIDDSVSPGAVESDFQNSEMKWENEPALEADQVAEIEKQIGAGLLEEVIQVAEGELKLVNELYKSKAWEELEEKPRPGQWVYFERKTS